ncbi:hypothetical protein [Rhodococcus qingshengii]|nr:hypothetical protein [Rhodococcus qingshengii]
MIWLRIVLILVMVAMILWVLMELKLKVARKLLTEDDVLRGHDWT